MAQLLHVHHQSPSHQGLRPLSQGCLPLEGTTWGSHITGPSTCNTFVCILLLIVPTVEGFGCTSDSLVNLHYLEVC